MSPCCVRCWTSRWSRSRPSIARPPPALKMAAETIVRNAADRRHRRALVGVACRRRRRRRRPVDESRFVTAHLSLPA
ncbi:MAG: hypothetical protein MZV49_02210 [Rhodopseudomonas palustris]|nr:hypothetical protein [Rhodopseudomonas palustris]